MASLDPMPVFAPLPLRERLAVRARLLGAPLRTVASVAPDGLIADIGCGHGLLTTFLANGHPERQVIGVDPDPRFLRWAKLGPGKLSNVELRLGILEDLLPALEGRLDAVTVADALFLIPRRRWTELFASARRLLKAGGVLLLKETQDDGGWKAKKSLAERAVRQRLRPNAPRSFEYVLEPRAVLEGLLREAGLRVARTVDLSGGYSAPHLLIEARPA